MFTFVKRAQNDAQDDVKRNATRYLRCHLNLSDVHAAGTQWCSVNETLHLMQKKNFQAALESPNTVDRFRKTVLNFVHSLCERMNSDAYRFTYEAVVKTIEVIILC